MLDPEFLQWPVYGLTQADKRARLQVLLSQLTQRHARGCEPYRRILAAHGIEADRQFALEDVPFIPARLFKLYDLLSVERESVVKVLTSSGTTGQATSRIHLDRVTAGYQSTALVRILQDYLGKARLPMLIVDHPGVIKDRRSFSARGAGIQGLSSFGRDPVYALRDDMTLDLDSVQAFCRKHRDQPKLVFGFTFMLWQHLLLALEARGARIDLAGAIVVHSGGWKKLQDLAVDNATFKRRLRAAIGASRIHNFYGMVEQIGSIFVECEHGNLHAPAYADLIVRDPTDWSVLPIGHRGVVQVVSCLPTSYPGHSLLTEDSGTVVGEDDCACGRLGRTVAIHGRIARSEVRGCSDTQPAVARSDAVPAALAS